MADQLTEKLASFRTDLSVSVAGFMGELMKDRTEAAQAWNSILSAMRTSGDPMTVARPVKAEVGIDVKSIPEVVEETAEQMPPDEVVPEEEIKSEAAAEMKPEPEKKAEDEPGGAIVEELNEKEGLISEILGLLEDTPDGLRMVELAETLGVENWRSLIPIMKELLDDGDVKKEDSTYFIA
jgi:hypothetical protein